MSKSPGSWVQYKADIFLGGIGVDIEKGSSFKNPILGKVSVSPNMPRRRSG